MKILHVTPAYEPAWHLGGVVRSVSQLCRGLAALGHEVTVFTTDSAGDRPLPVPVNQAVRVAGVKVYYFRTDFSYKYSYSRALRAACRQSLRNFDIVHLAAFWCYPGIPARRETIRRGVPYVVSTRGGFVPHSLAQKPWGKKLYFKLVEEKTLKGAGAIHYTAALEKEQTSHLGLRVPGFVVPNGLDLSEFVYLPTKSEARAALAIPMDIPVILYLGRIHPRKGLDFLLEAFAQGVNGSRTAALLILAGPDGGQQGQLQAQAQRLGVAQQVWFPGYVAPQKRNLFLRSADIFSLATYPGENFGNAAVEAMLAGVPVLVSEQVGICREVAADGAGVVVPLTVEAIARALQGMLADPEGLKAMGERAAAAARRRYDLKVVAQLMATAYEDILTGRRSPGLGWSDG